MACKKSMKNVSELSLNSNTLLLLDETKIEAGGLTQIGTGNIGAISELIEKRTIKFDYQFYQKDFEADITCISLTFGKSLLSNGNLYKNLYMMKLFCFCSIKTFSNTSYKLTRKQFIS